VVDDTYTILLSGDDTTGRGNVAYGGALEVIRRKPLQPPQRLLRIPYRGGDSPILQHAPDPTGDLLRWRGPRNSPASLKFRRILWGDAQRCWLQ